MWMSLQTRPFIEVSVPSFIVTTRPRRSVLRLIDQSLVRFSRVFGTGVTSPVPQQVMLLTAFAVIHISAFLVDARIAWILLWMGYFGVLAVGRAWVANEKQRTAIARKLSDVDPDELPDLRLSALLSALQLIVIIPLLLRSSDALFGLFSVPVGAGFADWLLLGVDLLFRSLLDWSEIYGVQVSNIGLDAMGGRHLVMLFLLTIDFILIQGLLRIFAIRRTIDEGVSAAVRDPEMGYRLGKRASPRLLALLDSPELNSIERGHLIEALAVLGEDRAAPRIVECLEDETLHTTAVAALVALGSIPPLMQALSSPEPRLRNGAITAFGRIGNPATIPALLAQMGTSDADTRERIVRALSRMESHAQSHLLGVLDDEATVVRLAALQGLTNDTSDELMQRLLVMIEDPDAEIRLAVVDALQRFSDGRIVKPLAAALTDDDTSVARQAQRSLDHLQSVVARSGGE
jgi:hypothetical protein